MQTPACPYCEAAAELVNRVEVDPDHPHGKAWVCWPCEAWIECHLNSPTFKPVGRLAKRELHEAKAEAISAFNKLWKTWGARRADAYHWLSSMLDIPIQDCDFGKFDLSRCYKAFEIVDQFIPMFEFEDE